MRNRVKRRLRELFRRDRGLRERGLDLIVHARAEAGSASAGELAADFDRAVSRLRNRRKRR